MIKLVFILTLVFGLSILAEKSEDSASIEDFIPTNEWQIVKEGQKVPPGLHVRLNLETGLREAKLLDPNDQSSSSDIISVSPEAAQEEISRQNLEKAFAALDLSTDDVVSDPSHEEEVRKKFRPYEELKKDFEDLNIKIQTDQEILTKLTTQLKETNNNEDRKTILTDLEYYLHQYDNAILFADMNGLDLLIDLLNSTESDNEVRTMTSLALGAAFQGNPKVQEKAIHRGCLQHLLRLLNKEHDEIINFRMLFTLSTLLRNFPSAQEIFLEHGGAELMVKILDQKNQDPKVTVRAIALMHDLIIEKDHATDNRLEAYQHIHIVNQLVDHGWCSRVSTRLTTFDTNNFDHIEKTINAMIPLIDACRMEFVSTVPTLNKLKSVYTSSHSDDDSAYADILKNIQTLLGKLLQQRSSDDL